MDRGRGHAEEMGSETEQKRDVPMMQESDDTGDAVRRPVARMCGAKKRPEDG